MDEGLVEIDAVSEVALKSRATAEPPFTLVQRAKRYGGDQDSSILTSSLSP